MHLKNKGKYKRNLVSYWAMENPILADGEIIVVETFDGNTRIKVGDGVSSYGELPYMDEDEGIETTISQYNVQRETKTVTATYEPVKEVIAPKTPKLDPVPVIKSLPVVKPLPVVNPTPTPVVETTEAFVNVNLKGTFINEQKLNPADVIVPSEHFTDIFATKEKLNPTLIKKPEPIVREEPTPEVPEVSQEEPQKVIEEETQPKPRRTRRPRKARAQRAKVTTEV